MTSETTLTPIAPPKEPLARRISDWTNPIVVKELRRSVQSRFVVAALLILLTIQIAATGIYLLVGGDPLNNFDTGRYVFMVLFGILLAVGMLFVPLYSGVRLAAERSETNLDLLFITTIKPRSIIAGKFLAAVVLTVLIFSACLPFLTFTYFLRGIDLPSMAVVLVLGFAVVLLCSQIAIFVACLPLNRAFKFMLGLLMLVFFAIGYFSTMAGASQMFFTGIGSRLGEADFWQWVGIFALNFAGLLGLLFVLSVALITPASANRALPVRLYLTILWLLGAAAALTGSQVERTHDPVIFWQAAFNVIFAIALFVAVSERDQAGRRVLRDLPASGLKRPLAFFLFSGAANGLLWASVMIAATYGVCWMWWTVFPNFSDLGDFVGATRWFTVMNLYLYSYALAGALLRRHLLGRMPARWTWLLSTSLVVLGSIVPFAFGAMFFMSDKWWSETYGKWLVGNPFAWDVEAGRELYLSVSAAAAVLLTALTLPWFLERTKAFQVEMPGEKLKNNLPESDLPENDL
ncbi:MAG TPA: hypothetical protein PKD31_11415 [Blastocatellia bacterium]|nr:hypothetical protein [Blastocatellia bacterium]